MLRYESKEKTLKQDTDNMKTKPSQETNEYWITSIRSADAPKYPAMTGDAGKWLVFADIKDIDAIWEKISDATEKGLLGGGSKVSTAKINSMAKDRNQKVICVYTYDVYDVADLDRVRDELTKLGITQKIPYKTNDATRKVKYEIYGDKKISTYYK